MDKTKSRAFTFFILLCGLVCVVSLPAKVAAQRDFKVTAVSLQPDDAKPKGKCPMLIKFKGFITTNGKGTVKYTFTRSDGATSPAYTLNFTAAGTKPVTTDWTLGSATVLPHYEGWRAIKILSPNEMESSHETGSFVLDCEGARQQPQQQGKADLVVDKGAIKLAQSCQMNSPALIAQVVVRNIGTATSEARSEVGLVGVMDTDGSNWSNGVGLPAIAPGAAVEVSIPIYYLIDNPAHMRGRHEFKAFVNSGNWIVESNTGNNAFSGTFAVEIPDGFCRR